MEPNKEKLQKYVGSTKDKTATDLKTVLLNALKMQALYSGGKLKFVETSNLVN